jgi:hypothetical protein
LAYTGDGCRYCKNLKDLRQVQKRIAAGKTAKQKTEIKAEDLQAAIHTAMQMHEPIHDPALITGGLLSIHFPTELKPDMVLI